MTPARNKSGFTLLEIVVSIVLLALMALMLTRVFNESSRVVEQGRNRAALDESARLLLDVIEQDLGQAVVRTNVPFRVESLNDPRDALYFISTGVRRQHENILRDTAPMRIQAAAGADGWSRQMQIESAADASGNSAGTRLNLIHHSNTYFTNTAQTISDFDNAIAATTTEEYTQALESNLEDHAVLTFIKFTVNADPGWKSNPTGPPNTADMPRFVDVSVGLVSSTDINLALLKNTQQYYLDREQVFNRRIFLRNTGVNPSDFQP